MKLCSEELNRRNDRAVVAGVCQTQCQNCEEETETQCSVKDTIGEYLKCAMALGRGEWKTEKVV